MMGQQDGGIVDEFYGGAAAVAGDLLPGHEFGAPFVDDLGQAFATAPGRVTPPGVRIARPTAAPVRLDAAQGKNAATSSSPSLISISRRIIGGRGILPVAFDSTDGGIACLHEPSQRRAAEPVGDAPFPQRMRRWQGRVAALHGMSGKVIIGRLARKGAFASEISRGPRSSVGHARINRSCEKAGCAPGKRGFEGQRGRFQAVFVATATITFRPCPTRSRPDSASALTSSHRNEVGWGCR